MTVDRWGLRLPDGGAMVSLNPVPGSSPVPLRLEPRAHGSWLLPTHEVARFCAERGVRQQNMIAFVDLADGRTIKAKKRGIGLAYEYEGR